MKILQNNNDRNKLNISNNKFPQGSTSAQTHATPKNEKLQVNKQEYFLNFKDSNSQH